MGERESEKGGRIPFDTLLPYIAHHPYIYYTLYSNEITFGPAGWLAGWLVGIYLFPYILRVVGACIFFSLAVTWNLEGRKGW